MLTIEMGSCSEAEEELGAVSVRASICHGEDTTACMTIFEVLISEGTTVVVDGCAASAVVVREVTTLGHESCDNPMER